MRKSVNYKEDKNKLRQQTEKNKTKTAKVRAAELTDPLENDVGEFVMGNKKMAERTNILLPVFTIDDTKTSQTIIDPEQK